MYITENEEILLAKFYLGFVVFLLTCVSLSALYYLICRSFNIC